MFFFIAVVYARPFENPDPWASLKAYNGTCNGDWKEQVTDFLWYNPWVERCMKDDGFCNPNLNGFINAVRKMCNVG
jgi:hypothetical protein